MDGHGFAIFCHITCYGFIVNGYGKSLVDQLFPRKQSFLKSVILGVTELKVIFRFEVYGACISMKEFPNIGQNGFKEDIQIFYFVDIQAYLCNQIDLFFFVHQKWSPLLFSMRT